MAGPDRSGPVQAGLGDVTAVGWRRLCLKAGWVPTGAQLRGKGALHAALDKDAVKDAVGLVHCEGHATGRHRRIALPQQLAGAGHLPLEVLWHRLPVRHPWRPEHVVREHPGVVQQPPARRVPQQLEVHDRVVRRSHLGHKRRQVALLLRLVRIKDGHHTAALVLKQLREAQRPVLRAVLAQPGVAVARPTLQRDCLGRRHRPDPRLAGEGRPEALVLRAEELLLCLAVHERRGVLPCHALKRACAALWPHNGAHHKVLRVGVQCLWVDEVAAQREGGRVGAGHVGEGGEGLRDLLGERREAPGRLLPGTYKRGGLRPVRAGGHHRLLSALHHRHPSNLLLALGKL
mmetsp:Transcript_19361/g.49720  ORF Transcript_19361/g.49720 Transcript_19361/m.49720 type:complete len:346 (-) Transcript_19361:6-1043(-)